MSTLTETLATFTKQLGSAQPDSISNARFILVKENEATEDMPAGKYLLVEMRFVISLNDAGTLP